MNGLNYEIKQMEDGEWQVWTPACDYNCGACIGSGPTRESAISDARLNLISAYREMIKEK